MFLLVAITRACSSPLLSAGLQSLLRSFLIQAGPSPGARQYSQILQFLHLLPVQLPAPGLICWASRQLAFLFEVPLSILRFPSLDGRSALDDVEGGRLVVHRNLRHLPFMMCREILFLLPVSLHWQFERLFAKSSGLQRLFEKKKRQRGRGIPKLAGCTSCLPQKHPCSASFF